MFAGVIKSRYPACVLLIVGCLYLFNTTAISPALALNASVFTKEDCVIQDLGLDLQFFSPGGNILGKYDSVLCDYYSDSDHEVRLEVRFYWDEPSMLKDLSNPTSGAFYFTEGPTPEPKYQIVQSIRKTGDETYVSFVKRNTQYKDMVSGYRAFYRGTKVVLISCILAGYSDSAAIAALDKVEARARSLDLTFVSPAPAPAASLSPSVSAFPTVSASPSPPGSSWTGWMTLETTPSLTAADAGMVLSHSGRVEVKGPGSGDWKPARAGMLFGEGTSIRTLDDGMAELELTGNRLIRMDHGSRMEVPVKQNLITIGDFLELIRGSFWLWLQKTRDPYTYTTPNAIAGVKGTKFEVVIDDSGTAVNVLEGVVEVSDLNRTVNVSVGANQKTMVPIKGVPAAPAGFDPAAADRWWTQFPPSPADPGAASPGTAAAKPAPGADVVLCTIAMPAAVFVFSRHKKRGAQHDVREADIQVSSHKKR